MKSKYRLRIFTIFSIILLCTAFTLKVLQNDTFYIIKLGGDILKNGIDMIDNYSWISNLPYTYPHWLYDVFMYIIYSNFDFIGVYVSSIVLFIILIISFYIINLKFNKNEFLSCFLSIVIIPIIAGFVTARSQLVTIILFLWQVYFIEMLINSGNKKYVIFLMLISLLVANLHATIWPFYFILYLPFIGEHIIYKIIIFSKKKIDDSFKLIISKVNNFKMLVISTIGGFFMGFLSPSKICFTYVFKIMQGDSQNYIIEHDPLVLIENIPFVIFLLIILLVLMFTNTKIKLRELFMICGLIFMSFCSFRHIAFFYIIGLLYVSILCNRYLNERNDFTLDILGNMFVRKKFIYLLGYVLIILVSFNRFKINNDMEYISLKDYPVDASIYIKNNLDYRNIKLYNQYNIGAYLLFNDIPVFIDSRCDLYLKEFNGLDYSTFDDAMSIQGKKYDYDKYFEFYGVTHALVMKGSVLERFFLKDYGFNILYEDDYFALFEVISSEF